ncbi:MAG: glycoside hydrolase family 43 protein [Propionibacteriaceae bacterium]|jgi:hypothetical protein|nr:glycoside hydrolase family 43 protein [Propionibacteriaceae bacterium]
MSQISSSTPVAEPGRPRSRRRSPRLAGLLGLALVAGLLTPALAAAPAAAVTLAQVPAPDGSVWLDVDGQPIKAHGGSVVAVEEARVGLDITGDGAMDQTVWLWYGEDKTDATRPVNGVRGYWSTDLVNWHDMGLVLPTHQFFTLQVTGGQVVVDQAKVDAIKATANLTEPTEQIGQAEIDRARAFVAPYVETWTDQAAGLAASYDEANLANASYRLNGNINIMERPKLLWNAKTGQFVIIYHADGPLPDNADLVAWVAGGGDPADTNVGSRYSRAEIGFAVSDTPWGPFRLVNTTKMNWSTGVPNAGREGDSRDMTVFQDSGVHTVDPVADDAYAVYSSEMNKWMYISRLNAEYTGPLVEGEDAALGQDFSNRVLPDVNREASSVFKYDGWYYMLTSGTDGWNSTAVIAYRSRSMITDTPAVVGNNNGNPASGQWTRLDPANPCVGVSGRSGVGTADPSRCFDSQPTFVIALDQDQGQFIYMGDRWITESNGSAGERSRYVWAPIQVDSERASLTVENVGAFSPTNASLYRPLSFAEPLAFQAQPEDRDSFNPVFSVAVDGQTYSDLTADWSQSNLDAAFASGGWRTIAGHIATPGSLQGRYLTASLKVASGNVCAEASLIAASFHQTSYGTFPASLACDGDIDTAWSTWASATARQDQVSFTLEYAADYSLRQVAFTNAEGTIVSLTVQWRDPADGVWKDSSAGVVVPAANGVATVIEFEPVVADGLRLIFETPGSYLKIPELQVLGQASLVNLCQEPGSQVEGSFHQTNYGVFPAALACDGDSSTSWSTWASSGQGRDQVTWSVVWVGSHQVGQVAFTNIEGTIAQVAVWYQSPDGLWAPTSASAAPVAANNSLTSLSFDPVVATGLRLVFDTPGSYLKITELAIPGQPVEDTPEPEEPISLSRPELVCGGDLQWAEVGQECRLDLTVTPEATELTYLWFRDGGHLIPGADGASYTVQPGDQGLDIVVKVIAGEPDQAGEYGQAQVKYSNHVMVRGVQQGVQVTRANLPATAEVGQTLTLDLDFRPTTAEVDYTWFRGQSRIAGADGPSYTVTAADAGGQVLKVKLTVTAPGQTALVRYSTGAQVDGPQAPTVAGLTLKVAGALAPGRALTAQAQFSPSTARAEYSWFRDSVYLGQITGPNYVLTAADLGHDIVVKLTLTAPGFEPISRYARLSVPTVT